LGGAGSPLGRTLGGYTAPPSTPSSTGALVPQGGYPQGNGRLVSGRASRLDAFSGYPLRRGCPAVPCRTTGTLEAAAPRSSRTEGTFPSGGQRPRQVETDLSRDGLTHLTFPFNGRAAPPLAAAAPPGWEETTSGYQTAGSMGTLTRDEPVIPGVAFLSCPAPTGGGTSVR